MLIMISNNYIKGIYETKGACMICKPVFEGALDLRKEIALT